jgi:ABC-2 type transport system ATP-binding protein
MNSFTAGLILSSGSFILPFGPMTDVTPAISLDRLCRRYGEQDAVHDLTVSISPGEIFGLLGPNGAGKSTTLKMLATLLKPTAGSATIAGFDVVGEANSVRRIIGYVPEGADLYEVLTGEEFLHLVGDLHGIPPEAALERRRRFANAFEIDGDLGRSIGEYSKGMKQKLLLIATLLHEPAVLLLDEPLDGLDVTAQEVMKALLRERADAGCAVVYSSHILEVVERVCDRVAILHHGRLAALGTPSDIAGGDSLARRFLAITGAA